MCGSYSTQKPTEHYNLFQVALYQLFQIELCKEGAASNGVIELSLSRDTWSYTYIIYIYVGQMVIFTNTCLVYVIMDL